MPTRRAPRLTPALPATPPVILLRRLRTLAAATLVVAGGSLLGGALLGACATPPGATDPDGSDRGDRGDRGDRASDATDVIPAADGTDAASDGAPDQGASDGGPDTADALPPPEAGPDAEPDLLPPPSPAVITLAGSSPRYDDGPALERDLQTPTSVAVGPGGLLVVADPPARRLRGIASGAAAGSAAAGSAADQLTTVAGTGEAGYLDGPALGAHLDIPIGLSADGQGDLYLLDHDLVRRLAGGQLASLAGTMFMEGWRDGEAAQVLFTHAVGLAVDAARGRVYIADTGNHRIRLLEGGVVSTLAGSAPGFADGPASQALLLLPTGIALLPDGSLLVSDATHRLRRLVLDADGPGLHRVETLAGSGEAELRDGPAAEAAFSSPAGVAVAPDGTLYVADSGNHRLRRLRPDGAGSYTVDSLAGDVQGVADGPAAEALFDSPGGLVLEPGGSLLVVDTANGRVRRLSPGAGGDLAAGQVTTVAGRGHFRDGPALAAVLANPAGAALLPGGDLVFADGANHRIRVLRDPFGAARVETLAGDGGAGDRNGPAARARFRQPSSVAVGADGSIYVADTGNNRLRRIAPAAGGEREVTTLAGTGDFGLLDGPLASARLASPIALALSADGQGLYVSDFGNARLRLCDLARGQLSTLSAAGELLGVRQLVVGPEEAVYFVDSSLGQLGRRRADGRVEILATGLSAPAGLALVPTPDGPPRLLFSHSGRDQIVELLADGRQVPLAGSGEYGFADGAAATAQLAGPAGLLWDGQRLLFADQDNGRLRALAPLPAAP